MITKENLKIKFMIQINDQMKYNFCMMKNKDFIKLLNNQKQK